MDERHVFGNDGWRESSCFVGRREAKGCSFFAYSWKLPAYSEDFLLTVASFSSFAYKWSFFDYNFSFFTCSWSFLAYSGKVRLIRALRDCKQRSSTVSKKAPTVSKKASPEEKLQKLTLNRILDNVAATSLSMFAREHAKEFALWSDCFVTFTKLLLHTKSITKLIPKQFRFGNSSTQITEHNSQDSSVRDR